LSFRLGRLKTGAIFRFYNVRKKSTLGCSGLIWLAQEGFFMATITSLGIGTNGLDSESIVTKLVALEKQPLAALQNAATIDKAKISTFGQIQSQFSALADVASRLSATSAWVARSASSSNNSVATITAASTASATSFTLDVDQLAKAQSTSSASITSGTYVGAGTLTISKGTWTSASGNASTDNANVGNADNAVPLAQAALTTAQATQASANATFATATTDLSNADAALAVATANAAGNNALLSSATAALAAATTAYTNANNTLTAANATLLNANTALTNANNASTTADAGVTTATTNYNNASNTANAATSALASANLASSSALADDNSAAINLAVYAAGAAGTNTPTLKSYSDAYTNWVTAVGANDHSTPSLQAAEDAALQAKNIAYGVLGSVSPSEQTAADNLTATADATDASALKGAAKTAAGIASSATASATVANNTLTAATATQTLATAAVATATNDVTNANAAQVAATNDLATAGTTLAGATSDQATAAANAAPTNAALATATSDQASAAAAYAIANAAATNANAAVVTAQTNLTNAQNGVGSARPTFAAANGSGDVAITVTATDTVSTLAQKINAANAGIVATVFNDGTGDRLQLSSKSTGAANGFRIQVSDTGDGVDNDNNGLSRMAYDPQNASFGMASAGLQATYGQDAKARINGTTVTSSSNTFANNFPGVSVTVSAVTTTNLNNVGGTETRSPITMSVSEDVTAAVKNVQDFITAYNALASNLADVTKYDAATKTPSIFQGDSSIVGMQNLLRSMVGSISNGSAYKRLSDVGIERQLDGTLSMNTTKLSAAANNGTELAKLFTTDNKDIQTNGFALKFANFSKGALASGGAVVNKASALQKELDTNAKDQTRINDRATAFETRLRKQYSALDAKMASLNALNAYVSQQITTWNKSTG
jgi:flagellar hook-associated protein 2